MNVLIELSLVCFDSLHLLLRASLWGLGREQEGRGTRRGKKSVELASERSYMFQISCSVTRFGKDLVNSDAQKRPAVLTIAPLSSGMVPFIPRLARLHFRHAPSSRNEMRGGSRPSQGRGGRAVPCAKVAGARGLAPRARAPSVDGAARTSTTTGFPREANSELHR